VKYSCRNIFQNIFIEREYVELEKESQNVITELHGYILSLGRDSVEIHKLLHLS